MRLGREAQCLATTLVAMAHATAGLDLVFMLQHQQVEAYSALKFWPAKTRIAAGLNLYERASSA